MTRCAPRALRIRIVVLGLLAVTGRAELAYAQGALVNGAIHTGAISAPGERDSWTYTASGQATFIRVAEIGADSDFHPRLELYDGNGVLVSSSDAPLAAMIYRAAPGSGTYTVVVSCLNGETGDYTMALALAPGTPVIPPGDEGGPMLNGVRNTGSLDAGDLDIWTFTATAGSTMIIRSGAGSVDPVYHVLGPQGNLVATSDFVNLPWILQTVPESGLYTVVAHLHPHPLLLAAPGVYSLTVALIPGAPEISADQGGPLTNGAVHPGSIPAGDIDLWTFTATAGSNVRVRIGAIGGDTTEMTLLVYQPNGTVYRPPGSQTDFLRGVQVVEAAFPAPASGTYTVVVFANFLDGKFDYRINVALPGPFVTSTGDEGGAIAAGVSRSGHLHVGDLDLWTFTATQGGDAAIRVRRTSAPGLAPLLLLLGPDGALVDSDAGSEDAAVYLDNASGGTYTVVVTAGAPQLAASGDYELTYLSAPLTPPNLHTTVTPPASVIPRSQFATDQTYTFTVTNLGTAPVRSADLYTMFRHSGYSGRGPLQFRYCVPACSGNFSNTNDNDGNPYWRGVRVNGLESITLTVVMRLLEIATDGAVVTRFGQASTVMYAGGDGTGPPADLRMTKTASAPSPDPNPRVTYTLTVTNLGATPASSVVVVDWRLGPSRLISCTAPNGVCATVQNVSWETIWRVTFAALPGHSSATITIVAEGGSNQAWVASANPDPNLANNFAEAIVGGGGPTGDTDGLPDDWETRFGLDPNSSAGVNGPQGDPDGDGLTNAQELALGTHPRGFFRSYLAEGARNAFFDARLAVLNVGNAQGRLLLRFLQAGGAVTPHFVELPQNRRLTIGNDVLAELSSPDFSTVLESDQPIVLDRTMSWNGGLGSHAETGVPSPSSTWYLAEGSTSGDFSLFYLLQNPNPIATVATVRYLLPFGQPPIERTYPLPANSRTTIPVDEQGPALTTTDVSAVITTPTDAPIIVERAMYRSTPTTAFIAGHGSAGVTAPATSWFLAEGATGPYFDCFILLANPNPQTATVTVDYLLDDGRTFTKQYTVLGQSRHTIWVDDEQIPGGSGIRPLQTVAVSSTVTSDVPIIVERTMWWPGPGLSSNFWTEAHNSPGAVATGTRWALAEGEVGGSQSAETYILIANTSATSGVARVTLHFANGASDVRQFALLPRSRRNVSVSTDFSSRPTTTFSAVIESLPSGGAPAAEIVVERAMYTSPGGRVWEAGTNALATRLPGSP